MMINEGYLAFVFWNSVDSLMFYRSTVVASQPSYHTNCCSHAKLPRGFLMVPAQRMRSLCSCLPNFQVNRRTNHLQVNRRSQSTVVASQPAVAGGL